MPGVLAPIRLTNLLSSHGYLNFTPASETPFTGDRHRPRRPGREYPPLDFIKRNQPELHRADRPHSQAVDLIKELVDEAQTCFFCPAGAAGDSTAARAMNIRKIDDNCDLWFLSAVDRHKDAELAADPFVNLYFQASPNSDFLVLHGHASISHDPAKIKELCQPATGTRFTDGAQDPRITVIKVSPTSGYYWDTRHARTVAGIKQLIGAAIGTTPDDAIEGDIGA